MKQRRGWLRLRPLVESATGLALLGVAVAIALLSGPAVANTPPGSFSGGHGLNLGQVPDSLPAGLIAGAESGNVILPESIRIPALGVDVAVLPVDVVEGTLQVPADPQVVGWWAHGAMPGALRGTAILAGHVNSATLGPGALANLMQLRPGDSVVVAGGGHELQFRIEAIRQYPKSGLPTAEAFSQEVEGRLAIVSCGGEFDPRTGHYLDNIIAYALPV